MVDGSGWHRTHHDRYCRTYSFPNHSYFGYLYGKGARVEFSKREWSEA